MVSLGVFLAWGGERRSAVDGAGLTAGPGLVVGVETDGAVEADNQKIDGRSGRRIGL